MSWRSPITVAIAAVACLGLLAGCSDEDPPQNDDQASGAQPSAGPQAPAQQPGQAPKVDKPLDIAQAARSKCSLMPEEALAELGITDAGTENDFGVCMWDTGTVSLTLHENKGLDAVYQMRADGRFDAFEPGEIAGYPSVTTTPQKSPTAACSVFVGVSDTASFTVAVTDPDGQKDPCDVAEDLSEAVVEKLANG
ncbi:DUF3558 domain-containing protein [Thermocrispum sp.]|uniref:DUF3558 domain-containing protein n=1 Tax=Thermocrispum agreste TaxID=37925 RepID=A0A2W4JSC8_9PSEU|nr:DUF3558 domain-containing protein [Thermocrispum sp.]PZN01312.1 MAG: hypothetical protein DIU77_01075 [Thermocrispum agreste]